jgi:hypothetical protein
MLCSVELNVWELSLLEEEKRAATGLQDKRKEQKDCVADRMLLAVSCLATMEPAEVLREIQG